ncbi:sulfite exporter TauE/SafE family protein [Oligoflexus sp.]|uniref:sulfite exporter TauE/SafE family protein n=1 Tax=Oligoflexus sp. TaxID=1971216 RepID=UPI0032C22A6D
MPLVAPDIVGFLVGILSALTGLCGGFFYIPAFVLLGGCSIKEAVGTSLATVFLTSANGRHHLWSWPIEYSHCPAAHGGCHWGHSIGSLHRASFAQ